MAATSQAEAVCTPISNVAVKTEPGSEGDLVLDSGDVNVKREPVLPLMSPPCGQQPLVWSQDHRLAVCTSCSLAVMELVCDVHSNKQDLVLLRTSLPVPNESPKLQVRVYKSEVRSAFEKSAKHNACKLSLTIHQDQK